MSADEGPPMEKSAQIRAAMRHADLPDGANAELIGPLIDSYLARVRSHPRTELLGDEPAFRFDPSWDEDPPGEGE